MREKRGEKKTPTPDGRKGLLATRFLFITFFSKATKITPGKKHALEPVGIRPQATLPFLPFGGFRGVSPRFLGGVFEGGRCPPPSFSFSLGGFRGVSPRFSLFLSFYVARRSRIDY